MLEAKLAARLENGAAESARRILEGRFRFLNDERRLADPFDWRMERHPDVDHLWRFHLHSQEYLLDLLALGLPCGHTDDGDGAWPLVSRWIDGNRLSDPRALDDAWHPFCISRRLPVWMLLWHAGPPQGTLGEKVLSSMVAQTRFLDGHLERDLGGNHLLENAKALVLAGTFFLGREADRWRRRGMTIVQKELAEQILPHGEHFERSPMYHAHMLEAMLDVRDAVREIAPSRARETDRTARAMAEFLQRILHPDGEIPLLGDSCFGEAPSPDRLAWRLHRNGESGEPTTETPAVRVGDYWTWRDGGDFLLFDMGPVGPDHLPAHAHCDLLTIEASLGGRRLIVDSGVFNYADDEMRRYCRSTAAHNVLQINGRNQCDVWSRFRMGERGRPTARATGESHGLHWARAEHNAYRRLGVRRVGRWIACRTGGPWFVIDWADGRGIHALTNRLHLHPDVIVESLADDSATIALGAEVLWFYALAPGQLDVESGWYSPEFGRRVPSPVLCWTARSRLPAACGWMVSRNARHGRASLRDGEPTDPILEWKDRVIPVRRPIPCSGERVS